MAYPMQDASPQLENGYTRIANELLEALAKYPDIKKVPFINGYTKKK